MVVYRSERVGRDMRTFEARVPYLWEHDLIPSYMIDKTQQRQVVDVARSKREGHDMEDQVNVKFFSLWEYDLIPSYMMDKTH